MHRIALALALFAIAAVPAGATATREIQCGGVKVTANCDGTNKPPDGLLTFQSDTPIAAGQLFTVEFEGGGGFVKAVDGKPCGENKIGG